LESLPAVLRNKIIVDFIADSIKLTKVIFILLDVSFQPFNVSLILLQLMLQGVDFLVSLLQHFIEFLTLEVKLFNMLGILSNGLPEVLDFCFQISIIIHISRVLQEDNVVLGLDELLLVLLHSFSHDYYCLLVILKLALVFLLVAVVVEFG